MKLDVKKNTAINVIWGTINKIVLTIFPFLTRTIIIRTLGADYVGLSGLFNSILSFLNISDLGISTAIVCTMYAPIANDDHETICALMRFYRNCYRVIAGIIIIAGVALIPFLHLFINGDIPSNIDIYILYIIYLANTISGYTFLAYRDCLFSSHQQNNATYKIQTFTMTLQYMGQIAVLLIFKDYYLYAIFLPASTILYNLLVAYQSQKRYPQYCCKGKVPENILGQIKRQVMGLVIGKVNVAVRNSLDSIFISSFIGLIAVGMYSNYYMVISSVMAFIDIISVSLVAGVGNRIVLKTKEENYMDFNHMFFCSQWLIGFCAICVFCLIQPFMRIWAGERLLFKNGMAIICGLYVLIGKINLIGGVYLGALGLWWQMKVYNIIDIPMNILMNWFFVYKWGAYGVVLATVICLVTYGIPLTTRVLFKNYFGINKYKKFLSLIYKYMAISILVGVVTYSICMFEMGNNFGNLLFRLGVCLFVPNILYWIIYHRSDNYKFFISLLINMKKKLLRKGNEHYGNS